MQRMGKRFVSMLIIIAMLIAILPAQALAAERKLETSDEIFSESAPIEALTVGVNPKFCVKSISGANRAKFICCGSRLVRLPPW